MPLFFHSLPEKDELEGALLTMARHGCPRATRHARPVPRATALLGAKRPTPSETARVQIGLHGLLGWPPAHNSTFDEVAKILFPTFASLLFIPKQTNK